MRKIIYDNSREGMPRMVTSPWSINPLDVAHPGKFVYVPQSQVFISRDTLDIKTDESDRQYYDLRRKGIQPDLESLDWESTHFYLANSGFFMPSPKIFLEHYKNVRDAALGGKPLINANGSVIDRDESISLWSDLSSPENDWKRIWLDASFYWEMHEGTLYKTDNRVKIGKGRVPYLVGKNCKFENDEISLFKLEETTVLLNDLSPNGFTGKKAIALENLPGVNILYIEPQSNSVASFSIGQDSYGTLDYSQKSCPYGLKRITTLACAESTSELEPTGYVREDE